MVWVPPTEGGKYTLKCFELDILSPGDGQIRTISIDTSKDQPTAMWTTKICHNPFPRQEKAIDLIIREWKKNNHNLKTFIYGERGTGKTYTSMLLKKKLDQQIPNADVRLYDDFDPSVIGVNIETIALTKASEKSPVILLIDEIDVVFDETIFPKESYDPRIQHSKNSKTFRKMLDNIGNYKHVLAIYTSEKDPYSLASKKEEFRSYLRPGRIDLCLNMKKTDCLEDNDYSEKILNPPEKKMIEDKTENNFCSFVHFFLFLIPVLIIKFVNIF